MLVSNNNSKYIKLKLSTRCFLIKLFETNFQIRTELYKIIIIIIMNLYSTIIINLYSIVICRLDLFHHSDEYLTK